MATRKSEIATLPENPIALLEQTGLLETSEAIFEAFGSEDLQMPRLAFNMAKTGKVDSVTGRRVPNDVLFDLRSETVLGSELTGTILWVSKGRDYRQFVGNQTVLHCRSWDRTTGQPRSEKVTATNDDGTRECGSCEHAQARQTKTDDGRTITASACAETYEVLFMEEQTGEIYALTVRGASYRSFKVLVQRFYGVRVAGKQVNLPWFVRKVTMKLAMPEKADYAVCNWEVGEFQTKDFILWAKSFVEARLSGARKAA